jgi:hypothetical protein
MNKHCIKCHQVSLKRTDEEMVGNDINVRHVDLFLKIKDDYKIG